MIRKLLLATLLIGCCGLGACSDAEETEPVFPPGEENPADDNKQPVEIIERVMVEASDIPAGNADTRTDFTLDNNKLTFSWAAGDKIGIFTTADGQAQLPFSIAAGAGTHSAKFTGDGWALDATKTYVAYYPYNLNATLDNIPCSYEGQAQTGNATLSHLGAHDFMATVHTSAVLNETSAAHELSLHFKHLNSVAQFNLTVPAAGTFSALTILCNQPIFSKTATLCLSAENYTYTTAESTDRLVLGLNEVSTTAAGQVLTLYMNLPPTDMSGQTVKVSLRSSDSKVYESTITPRTMSAGKAYRFDATLVDVSVSTNEVHAPGFGESNI